MKLVIVMLMSVIAVGCTQGNAEVSKKEPVVMNAANEVCFEVDRDMKQIEREQGVEVNYYHSAECGTSEQYAAFNAGTYIVK